RPPSLPLATGPQHLGRPAARLLPSPCEPRHPTQRFEHLLHLNELLQQAIDLLNRGSAAPGDTLAAAPVDDVLLSTLLRRHGADDRFDAGPLLLLGRLVGQRLDAAQPREHSQNLVERTHLPNGPKLIAKILEGEFVRPYPALQMLGFLAVDGGFGSLDERKDVAHAQHAGYHPLGMKGLEVVEPLTAADERDRNAHDGNDRQGCATSPIALQLSQHDAPDPTPSMEHA